MRWIHEITGHLLSLRFTCAVTRPPAVLDPFPGQQLKQLPQFGGEHEERLLWGTYRPGYYFGAGGSG